MVAANALEIPQSPLDRGWNTEHTISVLEKGAQGQVLCAKLPGKAGPMQKKLGRLLYTTIILAIILSSCKGTPQTNPTPESLTVKANEAQVGPQIIAREPIEGQRLDLSPTLELTFDRDMNQDATSRAFTLLGTDHQPVPGKATWLDPRTFSFKPEKQLAPATDYQAVFSTDAVSADGVKIPDEIALDFRTAESLAIGQVFPADGTADIDMGTNITVIFNQPIVPVTIEEEQDKLPQPLIITPDVKGKGDWVNSSVYVFEPEENLQSGTRYTVRVDAGLKDVSGRKLDKSYTWQFITRAPSIGNYGLVNGVENPNTLVENARLDQAFYVDFLQPMDQESVKQATSLVNRETGKAFPIKLKWNKESTTLTVEPIGRYQIASFYDLVIADAALGVDGGHLKQGLRIKISTVPLPSIKSVYPAPNSEATTFDGNMTITFASPMKLASLKSRVVVTPAPKKELSFYYNDYDSSLNVYGLEPSTDYVVRLLPGMTDIYGNSIGRETSLAFTTGPMAPYARLAVPWNSLVYRAKGPQEVFFEHINLDSATIALYSMPLSQYRIYLNHPDNLSLFTPAAKPFNEWKIEKSTPRDELQHLNIKLTDRQGSPLPPGYYFIGVQGKPLDYTGMFYQTFLFTVATDNLTFKATDTEGLAWITDLETGAPQSNVEVTFYDQNDKALGKTKTDKNGVAYLKDIHAPMYAAITGQDHAAITSLNWGSGVSPNDFGIYETYYAQTNRPFAYVYTDRPVYRPGQDVFFKGILRQNDDLHYSLYDRNKVYVTIDHWGEQVYANYVSLSEMGSFTDKLTLDENAGIGNYDIAVRFNPSDDPFAFVSFNVAEYHKPEFEVKAAADQSAVLAGTTVNFDLNTTYYAGGNLANAKVDWFMQGQPYSFQPSKDYQQYSFSDWDRDTYWSEQTSTTQGTIDEGKAVTDENGHLVLTETMNLGEKKTSQTVTLSANVTDIAGNVVSGSASVVVHQSLVYAGIRSQKYIGISGEEQPFDLAVLDWASNPVPNSNLTVKFVERRWFSVQEQNKQGQLTWVTSVKEIPVGSQSVKTDADGKASVSFVPPNGGVFKALVTVTDSKGNQQQASTYIWVASNDYVDWKQTNDRSFNLVADKDSYSPGDTAEILIAQPFKEEVHALVTYERGHIYKQDVVLLKGNSTIYKLPITADMAPLAYVSVTVVNGAQTTGRANFKIGMAQIKIDTSEQVLDVNVTADKKSAGPGDDVTYTITTKDSKGKPVSADVSIAVVDKAVLALAPSNTPPLLDAFYPDESLSVRTALGMVISADDYNDQYREQLNEGGGSGGGGGGDLGIITVRQDFKDTAAFEGMVTTDEKGQAQVTVTLPENLTTWRADVRAVTSDSKVGQTTNEVLSTRPLFVEMTTPRFFVVGDDVQVGAVVHNTTDKSMKVSVSLEAQGVNVKNGTNQTVEVEAHQQGYVTWDVTVNDVERVDLTAHASSGDFTDASKPALGTLTGQGIPVFNFTAMETVGTSGMLLDANSVTEGMQLPTDFKYTDAKLSIEVAPSLAGSMQSGLTYLKDYPYLCIEQTISRFLPNVISMRALKAAGLEDPMLRNQLDANVNTALQRIYAKQLYDGGWNWWDGQTSDPYVTAYVVYGLLEAKDSGYPVSEGVLTTGIGFLKDHLPNLYRNASESDYNRDAFMLYVLARAKELGAGQTNFLYENRDMLSLYGKAYLTQTIHLLDPEDERIAALLSDLASASVLSASGAHWEESFTDYWNWNTDTRTTAIVLNTFIQIDPKNPITANAVRWLMAHRQGGHWYTTQETAWTLIALTNWLTATNELQANYPFAVGLNGSVLNQGNATKENITDTVKLQVDLKDLLKDEVNYLVFTRGAGEGSLYYTAYMNTTLAVDQVKALDQGVSLSREYFTLDDSKHPITEIPRGELVRVRLTVVVPAAVHYIVIDDPLPAGLEAVDASLNTSVEVPTSYTRQDYDQYGWGWWYFYHQEIRDEKVTLSTDYLPAGTYVYTYLARASTAGTFKVIPPTASEFYFPDVGGRGAGSVFVVKP